MKYLICILSVLALSSCGKPGKDGQSIKGDRGDAGPAGQAAVLEVIDPCGPQSAHDEVLLRLANGQLLASFSDAASGQNTRFSVIGPGSYITTDGTACRFTVGADLQVSF